MKKLINDLDEIIRWPKKPCDKEVVIKFLSLKFKSGRQYFEKEVNKIINQYHLFDNIALLRRKLISKKYLQRKDDGSEYWKLD